MCRWGHPPTRSLFRGNFVERRKGEVRILGILGSSYPALCIAPVLCPNSATVAGVSFGVSRTQSLPGGEVNRVEDKNRMKVTIWEAAEYLGVTPTTVQDMVERGVLKADKFAGAIQIPREEVERIERETAP
jgi:excisionase family DNA binding protein